MSMNIKAQATLEDYTVVVTVELVERRYPSSLEVALANVNEKLNDVLAEIVKAAKGDYRKVRTLCK